MRKQLGAVTIYLLCAIGAIAQTVTTTGGSANTVPLFTGTSTIGSSAISQSNGNVGIGTANPGAQLDITNVDPSTLLRLTSGGPVGFYHLDARSYVPESAVVSYVFDVYNNGHTYANSLTFSGYNGNIGIGTLNPGAQLDITNVNPASLLRLTSGGPIGSYHLDARSYTPESGVVSYAFDVLNDSHTYSNSLTFSGYNGNIGIGTASPGYKLDVAGTIHTAGSIIFSDGSTQSTAWTGSLCGGDYAESIDVSDDHEKYEPGDVLVIDPNVEGAFSKSRKRYATSVAGVYSTKPGVMGRRQHTDKSPNEIPMAVIGIVPVKVTAENGAIHPGDILVTSSKPGFAMKGTDRRRMFQAVIGKAMGSLHSGTGVIEVLVSLQ